MSEPVFSPARRTRMFALVLLLCAVMFTGCGGSGDGGAVNYQGNGLSGVRGTAAVNYLNGLAGPFANGTVVATITSCPVDANGHTIGAPCGIVSVAQTQTDAQGHFSLRLKPGTYGLEFIFSQSNILPYTFTNLQFTVMPLHYTPLDPVGGAYETGTDVQNRRVQR